MRVAERRCNRRAARARRLQGGSVGGRLNTFGMQDSVMTIGENCERRTAGGFLATSTLRFPCSVARVDASEKASRCRPSTPFDSTVIDTITMRGAVTIPALLERFLTVQYCTTRMTDGYTVSNAGRDVY